ncbi:hypothetical protein DPMN_158040 [Dreissena polymorpha]|uniref:Uncharacterized protein n=1 Tax=Dreissena polymorpha TaxID=45954 RepID=A0A9D4IMU4_DREPO|nr:hypothetical protein DPMN_158040 [Dreissena polymorpha]
MLYRKCIHTGYSYFCKGDANFITQKGNRKPMEATDIKNVSKLILLVKLLALPRDTCPGDVDTFIASSSEELAIS